MKLSIRQMFFGSVLIAGIATIGIASCTQRSESGSTGANSNSGMEQAAPQQDQTIAKVVTADEFEKLAKDSNTVLIDVRTPEEFNQGHIEGAVNMNIYGSFNEDIQKLDKDKTYLLYCRSGARSNSAMQTMKAEGFQKLYDLRGGIGSWQASGKPVK